MVNGELLSSLPPSVLGVLEGDRSGGSFNPIHSATLGEWEITTDHAVSGYVLTGRLSDAVAPFTAERFSKSNVESTIGTDRTIAAGVR